MLTVCSSSTSDKLTTLMTLKDELGIVDTKDDENLTDLIRRASGWAESYVGYPVLAQVYQETVAGFGSRHLMLSRTPIISVFRLYDSTDTGAATEVKSSEYRIEHPEAGFLSRDQGWAWNAAGAGRGPAGFGVGIQPADPDASFGERRQYLVDYAAGWIPPDGTTSTAYGTTSTDRTLPRDFEDAVILRVKERFRTKDANPAVASKRVGDLQITYRSEAEGPSQAERLLAPYRRVK